MTYEKENVSFDYGAEYGHELEAILATPLSPDNVNTYASDALVELIRLIERSVDAYSKAPTASYKTVRETEEAAFNYFDLDGIESILDFVAEKADELSRIDDIIAGARKIETVIIPPDNIPSPTSEERLENSEIKKIIPRLKIVLFILKNRFDIDIENPQQLELLKGSMNSSMMRQESYYSVTIPSLERSLLICDEKGNATYVLDTRELTELDLKPEKMLGLTKRQRNDLIDEFPGIGQRLQYGNAFVSRIVKLLEGKIVIRTNSQMNDLPELSFLKPEVRKRDGYSTIASLSTVYGISFATMQKVVDYLQDELTEARPFRHNKGFRFEYSPNDQIKIEKYLFENGYLTEKAPDNILSIHGLATKFDVSDRTVSKAINACIDQLGEIGNYKFGPRVRGGYQPWQQEIIRKELEDMNVFIEIAPDGVLSKPDSAKELGIAHGTLIKIVKKLIPDNQLLSYRFGYSKTVGIGLTIQQRNMLKQYLTNAGYYETAPENYEAVSDFIARTKIGSHAIKRYGDELGENYGIVRKYRKGQLVLSHLSPEQQKMILEKHNEKN